MSYLITVYDPKGEMFEVAPHIAKTCIVDHGWTTVPPDKAEPVFVEPAKKTAPAPEPKPEAPAAPAE